MQLFNVLKLSPIPTICLFLIVAWPCTVIAPPTSIVPAVEPEFWPPQHLQYPAQSVRNRLRYLNLQPIVEPLLVAAPLHKWTANRVRAMLKHDDGARNLLLIESTPGSRRYAFVLPHGHAHGLLGTQGSSPEAHMGIITVRRSPDLEIGLNGFLKVNHIGSTEALRRAIDGAGVNSGLSGLVSQQLEGLLRGNVAGL